MGQVFISYSHKDKEYVDRLAETLEKEGFLIWIDARIHYGSEWPKVVESNLDASDCVIIVMSRNSHESDMVQNEVTRAREKKKPIFPLLLDGENWLIVQTRQFVDVRDGSFPDEKFYTRLEGVTTRRKKEAIPPRPPVAKKQNASRSNVMLATGIAFMLIVMCLLSMVVVIDPLLKSWASAAATPTRVVVHNSPTATKKPPTRTAIPSTRVPTKIPTRVPTSSPTLTLIANTAALGQAIIYADPESGKAPLVVTFDANLILSDGDQACKNGMTCTYYWLVNGQSLVDKSFSYTFRSAGVYTITVTVCQATICGSTSTFISVRNR